MSFILNYIEVCYQGRLTREPELFIFLIWGKRNLDEGIKLCK